MAVALAVHPWHCDARDPYLARVEFGARLEPGNRIIHGAGQDPLGFDAYRACFDRAHQPLVTMTYIGLCHPVSAVVDWGIRVRGELAAMSPVAYIPQIGLNLTGGKEDGNNLDGAVAGGAYDVQIDAFADAVLSFRRPVFIRIGYEFDGSWNNYSPATFQGAWKRIAGRLRARSVPFASIWCAAGGSSGWPTISRLMEYYPGDAWVDWWGIDIFSKEEFANPSLEAFLAVARAHRKPVSIGEMTPRFVGVTEGERSWALWFEPMFGLLKRHPEIKAIDYIDWDWKAWSDRLGFPWKDWGDARLESNSVVRERWVKALSDPIFLNADPDGGVPLPSPEPGSAWR